GVDCSNLMADGTQPVKVLGAILGMPATKQIFGEKLCFELCGWLIEKTGYDFRNRVAHGFVHEGECYSNAAITLWWLVLRICLMPVFQAIAQKESATGAAESQIESASQLLSRGLDRQRKSARQLAEFLARLVESSFVSANFY